MSKEDIVLDALAWANVTEPARIAKVASKLVRGTTDSYRGRNITKASIAEAVKETHPPYGRGKAVIDGVTAAIDTIMPIWSKRQEAHKAWERHLAHQAEMSTRLNLAYAARFGRPVRSKAESYPGGYPSAQYGTPEWDAHQKLRQEWDLAEEKRDKGDDCIGLLIFEDVHTVCLLNSAHKRQGQHFIAVRDRLGGEPVYTRLRNGCSNFVEAAISLGGCKVRSAFSRGYPVLTDWVRRRTTITYPDGKQEILPWLTEQRVETPKGWTTVDIRVMGDQILDEQDSGSLVDDDGDEVDTRFVVVLPQ